MSGLNWNQEDEQIIAWQHGKRGLDFDELIASRKTIVPDWHSTNEHLIEYQRMYDLGARGIDLYDALHPED